jgi:helicase-like protein
VNLQHAHSVVNWDLPWSPSRLEQRLGRVDRIGQKHAVRGFNLVAENSIDARVMSVLEEKLAIIFAEFGADKRADIIETVNAHTDAVYAGALNGDTYLVESAEQLVEHARSELQAQTSLRDLLPSNARAPRTTGDRLTAALMSAAAARAQLNDSQSADPLETLEGLPSIAPGEPVPHIIGPEAGWWGVWEGRADASSLARTAFVLFITDSGGVRPDIAEQLWDSLMKETDAIQSMIPVADSWDRLTRTALNYAYRPCSELAGGCPLVAPAVRPLLVVRVTT